MCGIAGFLLDEPRSDRDALNRTLGSMTAVLHHRGPDDRGAWTDGLCGLGHARLSIIDLSPAGHQPMADADGRVHVVFNGEIYNFLELRAELERAGHTFRSRSDTEVVIEGYRAWGIDVVRRLRGMFAIALWDADERRLFLIRDRVGKKPLVYRRSGDTLLFGSEIKALLCWPGVPRRPNLQAIHDYLTFQYVPAPQSAFEGTARVPPAHYLEARPGGAVRLHRYWSLPSPDAARPRPEAELCEEFIAHLRAAVRCRMIADVPIGAFLSGGVDSSAVVAMMAEESSAPVKTFNIGFEDADFDERAFARIVAQRYGTDHHELVVKPDIVDILPKLVWHYGEPYADSSAVPSFYVAELARRHVKVVLNGDGGDESFLGYMRYPACRPRGWIDRLPHPLRVAAGAWGEHAPPWVEQVRVLRVLRRWAAQAGHLDSRRYEPSIAYFSARDKAAGYGDAMAAEGFANSLDLLEPYFAQAPSMVAGAAWADIHTYLPDDLLVKVDIATMAHGLEARSPLLDHELMAWAASIPDAQKMSGQETKQLMKRALAHHLPHEILYRPKMGFGVPIERWLKNELKEIAHDCVDSPRARQRGIFRPGYGAELLEQHCGGTRLHHPRLWAMIMLELWYRTWIDEPDPLATRTAEQHPPIVVQA
jgi:asparagine synthase (glutamine-hydrolysing)